MSEQGKDADELDTLRERVAELEGRLAERRRYGLVWEEPTGEEDDPYETEIVRDRTERELPLISEEPSMAIGEGLDPHLFIEGDNYFTLSGLTFTHQHAVDLIYIDPPYNTLKKNDFRYNDKRVAEDDDFRHSKWLSFMAPRLELARELMTEDGVILISIDDNEFATLKLLCDEIFSSHNFLGTIVWEGGRKNDSTFISVGHDYIIAYARDRQYLAKLGRRWLVPKPGVRDILDEVEKIIKRCKPDWDKATEELREFLQPKAKDVKELAKASDVILRHYPELAAVLPELGRPVTELPGQRYNRIDEQGAFRASDLSWPGGGGHDFDLKHPNGKVVRKPSRGWLYDEKRMAELIKENRIDFKEDEKGVPEYKRYLKDVPGEVLTSVFYRTRTKAQQELTALMGSNAFRFPKDVAVLKRIFGAALGDKQHATILDFFAGSGSTGQAVLEMNIEDGTNHQFILGTNNENGIAREVAHERLRRLMTGKCADGKPRPDGGEALGGSLRFFVSDREFITRSSTPDETREAFRTACRDLIRIKEDCFEPVKKTKNFEIFKGLSDQGEDELLGILYGLDGRESLIKALTAQPDDAQVTVYAFSLHSQANPKPFTDAFGSRLVLGSIPEQLLRTYERVFERRLYGGWNT
jgi:DNA modification methylase